MGLVSLELAKILGRGAMINTPGQPAFYMLHHQAVGTVKTLTEIYKPFHEWVLVDATSPLAMSTILPLSTALPRLTAWPGASPADVAAQIASDNCRLAALVVEYWKLHKDE
jgi:hypothetical protein